MVINQKLNDKTVNVIKIILNLSPEDVFVKR